MLDDYFVPKVNVPFERHLFKQMSQIVGETVDQSVCRLRQKAITCDFPNVDEAIRDQLIEKCGNAKLRRKFLEKANTNLKDLQDIARAFEAVEIQMKSLEQSGSQYKPEEGQVNSVRQFYKKGGKGNRYGDRARGLGLIKDASIVTTLVILPRIVPVLLEIGNTRNVELLDILLRAAENRTIKTQKKDIRKGMKGERKELIK